MSAPPPPDTDFPARPVAVPAPGTLTRAHCAALDAADPLASLRDLYALPEGVVYLDGNSLGPPPRTALERVARTVADEWGQGLIRSWNDAGWMDLPLRVGAAIAPLIGAHADEVVVADSTSVNLYKLLGAALRLRPDRRVVVSERTNFPTDLYVAQGLLEQLGGGYTLRLVERDEIAAALDERTAAVMPTEVDYRIGARLDMAAITARAHGVGALTLWDLAHSAGAIEVDLAGAHADFAVGCGYKYLNGGPGAPAFAYAARRHHDALRPPLTGWMGHATPFAFETGWSPAPGVGRLRCGSPPVLSMTALECGVQALAAAAPLGGMAALRRKSVALTDLFVALVEARCAGHGLELVSPRDARRRGSQVSWRMADGDAAYAIVQALIRRGVIGDFRAPGVLRFGFAPSYLRHADVWDAVEHLRTVLDTREWRDPALARRRAVT